MISVDVGSGVPVTHAPGVPVTYAPGVPVTHAPEVPVTHVLGVPVTHAPGVQAIHAPGPDNSWHQPIEASTDTLIMPWFVRIWKIMVETRP